jgi:hypothetical protein
MTVHWWGWIGIVGKTVMLRERSHWADGTRSVACYFGGRHSRTCASFLDQRRQQLDVGSLHAGQHALPTIGKTAVLAAPLAREQVVIGPAALCVLLLDGVSVKESPVPFAAPDPAAGPNCEP